MTDYIRDIPNGQMMIRDTGGWVEFWFKTGSSTWNNEQTWGYQTNGGYVQQDFRLAQGGAWQKFGAVFVDSRQDVLFRIIGEGLGWPTTDFWQFIERARVPDPPGAPYFFERQTGQIHAAFDYGYDGGMGIDAAELWYSFDPSPRWAVGGRDAWVSGLSPKTRYFFWGRVHNARGWSGFGPRSEAWTVGVPDQPEPPVVYAFNPIKALATLRRKPRDGGVRIEEFQIGYGIDPNTPQYTVPGMEVTVSNLQPARMHYFWIRARNAVGWSPWSWPMPLQLPAGAWLKDDGVWKRGLPWVKVNGVWQIVQPNIPVNGTWRVPTS